MGTEVVEVTISPDGKVAVHVKGIEGLACLTVTEQLVELLGGDVEGQELTADAYVTVEDEQDLKQWH